MGEVYSSRRALDTAILANFSRPKGQRKKAKELAEEFGVTIQAVRDQTFRLRQKGLLPTVPGREHVFGVTPKRKPEDGPVGMAPRSAETGPAVDPEILLTKVMSGEIVDGAERRKVLSIIIALGSDQNKLTAIKLLEEFERAKEDIYGPKEPATEEEALKRLSRIMLAAGKECTDKAYAAAFGGQDAETTVEQATN